MPIDDLIYNWIDVIWVPILFFGVHKKHRWWALGFVLSTMLIMRLLSEFMGYIGYSNGILGLLETPIYTRGLIVNTVYYVLFLLMAHFSPRTEGIVFMAACLSIFFMIFVTIALVMLL